MTSGSSSGVAPPASPVPLPRATNGRPWRRGDAHRGRDLVGRAREAHRRGAAVARRRRRGAYSASSSGSALAPSGPRPARRSARSACTSSMSRDYDGRRVRSCLMAQRRTTATSPERASSAVHRAAANGSRSRPGKRSASVADRRDVPHVVVAVHLRLRLPGRAHRADARAGAGLLLVRRPRSPTKADRDHVEQGGEEARATTSGSSKRAQRASQEGRLRADDGRANRVEWRTRLVDDACIFLNRPGFEAGPGCALHLHAMNTGQALQRDQARRCAGSSRCGASTTRRTTAP